jgi:hypothetical protein
MSTDQLLTKDSNVAFATAEPASTRTTQIRNPRSHGYGGLHPIFKEKRSGMANLLKNMVATDGVEPPTPAFSGIQPS